MNATRSEALNLVQHHKDSIEYLSKFGNPLERVMAQVVIDAAKGE